jgi:hypothetical protein
VTYTHRRQWVASRVTGVSQQFCYLSHCPPGGLPRDLRRYTMEMIDVAARMHEPTVVRKELSSKIHVLIGRTSTFEAVLGNVALTAAVDRSTVLAG